MVTRKAAIIQLAEANSARAIENVPERLQVRRRNLQKVQIVCKALLTRRKPIRPTADEVAQTGANSIFGFDSFPSRQTIYNEYSEILGYWRQAYDDIENLDASLGVSDDALVSFNPSDLDSGSAEVVRGLQRLARELRRSNNALKQIITKNISVDLDQLSPHDEALLDDLAYWISTAKADGFELTESGLVVSVRTKPGTVIMDWSLWNGLQRMIDRFQSALDVRNVNKGFDP